uniref:hypothetical protein n=1 Tax=Bordetella sputigena TaxID=1416810 RepID=UPI0039EDFC98
MNNIRDISKQNFTSQDGNTLQAINAGSLQRIADATERMAQRHTELIRERDNYQRWYQQEEQAHARTSRRLRAARGTVTKLRKQLADAPAAAAQGDAT